MNEPQTNFQQLSALCSDQIFHFDLINSASYLGLSVSLTSDQLKQCQWQIGILQTRLQYQLLKRCNQRLKIDHQKTIRTRLQQLAKNAQQNAQLNYGPNPYVRILLILDRNLTDLLNLQTTLFCLGWVQHLTTADQLNQCRSPISLLRQRLAVLKKQQAPFKSQSSKKQTLHKPLSQNSQPISPISKPSSSISKSMLQSSETPQQISKKQQQSIKGEINEKGAALQAKVQQKRQNSRFITGLISVLKSVGSLSLKVGKLALKLNRKELEIKEMTQNQSE